MNPCKLVQDLLPLYVDNTCSADSREYVEEHIQTCPDCKALFDTMKQSIEVTVSRPNPKESFTRFSRRLVHRRVLLISLGILAALVALVAVLWRPVINPYLSEPQLFPREDIETELSRLSDGSVYVSLTYTGAEYCVGANGFESDGSGEYTLNVQHYRVYDFLGTNDEKTYSRILHTSESEYIGTYTMAPATRLTLLCSDGDFVIWEEGDELPPADAEAEALLQQYIESGHCIPVEEWREKIESGEIKFG